MSRCKVKMMAFKLMPHDPLGTTVREIIDYQLAEMRHGLSNEGISYRDGIHEMRRRSKKIRALLRLVQQGVEPHIYLRENRCFSALSRTFNDVRDAEVLLETFSKIKEYHGFENGDYFGEIGQALQDHLHAVRQKQLDESHGVNWVVVGLQQASERLKEWEVDGQGWSILGSGLKKTYGQGQVCLNQALLLPSMTRLHEWRKKVRYLGFQLKLLQFLHPNLEKRFAQFASLASVLGYHHDLAVLRETLLRNALGIKDQHAMTVFVDCIEAQYREIEQEAFALGARLFVKKPEKFEQSMRKYWEC